MRSGRPREIRYLTWPTRPLPLASPENDNASDYQRHAVSVIPFHVNPNGRLAQRDEELKGETKETKRARRAFRLIGKASFH
jgi:hypothetical protein